MSKKKVEIELSSGDEDDVMEIKPKLEQTDPCSSVEIELSSGDEDEMLDVKLKLEETEPCSSSSLRS
jgi:inorganic triphosphatase YgiF